MQKLKDWFNALKPRERIIVSAGAVLVVLMIAVAALMPFYKMVGAREARVAQKRADLAWMRSVAVEMQILNRTEQPDEGPGGSLVVLVDRVARECGVSEQLIGQTPEGDNGIRVRLDGADFDTMLGCLNSLQQQHGVDIDSATIDRTARSGRVNASLILSRPAG